MATDDLYGDFVGVPVKFWDTHHWVRIGPDGLPQLIRVEPLITDEGQVILQNVVLTVDEQEPQIVDRVAALKMLSTADCEPLESMTQWKHKTQH